MFGWLSNPKFLLIISIVLAGAIIYQAIGLRNDLQIQKKLKIFENCTNIDKKFFISRNKEDNQHKLKELQNIHNSYAMQKIYDFPVETRKMFQYTQEQLQQLRLRNISLQSSILAKKYARIGLGIPDAQIIQFEKQYYQQKYQLNYHYKNTLKKVEFSFCILVPSFNNVKNQRYKLNLNSIYRQQYQNYRIVYIDDASTDNTLLHVKMYIKQQSFDQSRIKFYSNKKKKGTLQSIYLAAMNQCSDDDIILILNGEDGYVGTQTFKLFNHFYQTENAWFIYGNYLLTGLTENYGVSAPLSKQQKQKTYRKDIYGWKTSYPLTFYDHLFKKIDPSYLKKYNKESQQSEFYKISYDRAIVYPIIDMAQSHVLFLNQLLYLYNEYTDLSDEIIYSDTQGLQNIEIMRKPKMEYVPCLFQQTDNQKPIQQQQSSCQQARYIVRYRILQKMFI